MPRAKVEPRRYAEEEKKAALELGAAVGRNAAVRQLGISKSTFQQWTELYPELWSDLLRRP
jgi:transposase-like protein